MGHPPPQILGRPSPQSPIGLTSHIIHLLKFAAVILGLKNLVFLNIRKVNLSGFEKSSSTDQRYNPEQIKLLSQSNRIKWPLIYQCNTIIQWSFIGNIEAEKSSNCDYRI